MIKVNLLPGGKRRTAKRSARSFSMPSISGLPSDPWILAAVAVVAVGVGLIALLFLGVSRDRENTQVAVDDAVQDSARFADLIERTTQIQARRDSIAQRVGIIQEIDQGRYVWPHMMDEVARALPDYTWIVSMTQTAGGPEPTVRIEGRAGNTYALTVFMQQLEASPFIRNVELVTTQQNIEGQGTENQQIVYMFQVDASYVQPPMEFLETIPLFGAEGPATGPDSAGQGG